MSLTKVRSLRTAVVHVMRSTAVTYCGTKRSKSHIDTREPASCRKCIYDVQLEEKARAERDERNE